jgi:hypothetical protein
VTFVRTVVDWAVCFQRGQGMNFIDDSSSQGVAQRHEDRHGWGGRERSPKIALISSKRKPHCDRLSGQSHSFKLILGILVDNHCQLAVSATLLFARNDEAYRTNTYNFYQLTDSPGAAASKRLYFIIRKLHLRISSNVSQKFMVMKAQTSLCSAHCYAHAHAHLGLIRSSASFRCAPLLPRCEFQKRMRPKSVFFHRSGRDCVQKSMRLVLEYTKVVATSFERERQDRLSDDCDGGRLKRILLKMRTTS